MKVKKQILKTCVLTLIIILTCIFNFTCKPDILEEAGRGEAEYEYTNVVYSPDMKSVTIYLGGGVPVPRALSKPLALMGCDYFEVNFLDSASVLTRGEWMAGKMAGISGLTPGSYGNIIGANSAILFAGKSDKTLMAVGRLKAVDGVNGTTIGAGAKTITFELDAIKAEAATISGTTVTATGFVTAAKTSPYDTPDPGNTVVSLESIFHTVPTKKFPCFELERLRTVRANYVFKLASTAAFNNDATTFTPNYGIYVSPPAFAAPGLPVNPVERKIPRFTLENGAFHESILLLDEKTEINLINNNTADVAFNSTVKFTFDTTETVNGSVFSFAFSVPIYALKKEEPSKGLKLSRWYIRSSYGPNLYDLDDGTIGMGGGVLIKTGHIQVSLPDNIKIKIITRPNKWEYPMAPPASNRVFDISGLRVDLLYNDDTLIRTIPYDELHFIIGKYEVNATWSTTPGMPPPTGTPYSFDDMFFGIIEVTVEYIEQSKNNLRMTATFYVLVSGMGYDLATFDKVVHIYTGNSGTTGNATVNGWYTANRAGSPDINTGGAAEKLNQLFTNPPYGTSVLIVLHESFDITFDMNLNPSYPSNAPGPTLFFFVAGPRWDGTNVINSVTDPVNGDIVMGRERRGDPPTYPPFPAPYTVQGKGIIQQITSPAGMNGLIAYYFGEWPFGGTPSNVSNFPNTYPFRVNTRGPYASINSPINDIFTTAGPNNYMNKMITDAFLWYSTPKGDGGIYNVKVGPGAIILPSVVVPGYGSDTITTYPFLN